MRERESLKGTAVVVSCMSLTFLTPLKLCFFPSEWGDSPPSMSGPAFVLRGSLENSFLSFCHPFLETHRQGPEAAREQMPCSPL